MQGIDTKKVVLQDSGKSGEYYLEQIESITEKGLVQLAVIDSVTALIPKEILETELEKEARVGAGAKLMSRALPRIQNAAKKGNAAVIFINQIRQKIGVVYGNPETTPYGEALKFYASLRIRLSQVGSKNERGIMKGDDEIGIRTNVHVVKSRFGPPYRETIMPIYYSDVKPHPIDIIIDAALGNKVVKSRSKKQPNGEIIQTFSFGDIRSEGIGEFKKELTPALTKSMVAQVEAQKFAFGGEVLEYLASLENDPTK
jgi:recombination protein RecA